MPARTRSLLLILLAALGGGAASGPGVTWADETADEELPPEAWDEPEPGPYGASLLCTRVSTRRGSSTPLHRLPVRRGRGLHGGDATRLEG